MGRNHVEKSSLLKLPPWDQASAEFYFARSRDLLTKAITQVPSLRGGQYGAEGYEKKTCESNGSTAQTFQPKMGKDPMRSHQLFENRRNHDSEELSNKSLRLKTDAVDNSKHKTQKTNAIPSVFCKEVPLNSENPHQVNAVTLRKCGSKGHLRRRSYNDRYLSSTSSDSSDSFNFSESDKQMKHRLKMRKQRRGGSFSSHTSQLKSPQFSLNSPPPQNSFLNSLTSPKNTSNKNKFYFANLKPLKFEPIQHRSFNNLSKPTNQLHSGFEEKWPERVRDSSSLTFTSSNSSSPNWEEYLELDRDFLSCSNCPPSPAPQVWVGSFALCLLSCPLAIFMVHI